MSKIKAVVLEKSGFRYTVLAENGSFRHVRRRQNAEVGEEIEIQTGLESFGGLRTWAGVAALFLLVLTTLFSWNLYQAPTAVALLSVDINPSIQFTIDDQGHLIKIDTQNEDAEHLLSKIDLKGKRIDKVLVQIVTEAYNQKFINPEHPWVVVGYTSLVDDSIDQVAKDLNENQIVTWLTENVEENGFTPQVEFFVLTPQDRELAQKGDLTLGEYALWQTAVKAGVETQPERLRDTSERVRLLEDPKVRAQVKENKKELESPSSSFKGQKPELNKGKDQETENYQKNNDPGSNSEKGNERNKAKETGKEIKGEKAKEKGQEHKNSEAQINTIDKGKSFEKKGININYSPLRWVNAA